MGLISLLIALAAENKLTAKVWQFNFYYNLYIGLLNKAKFSSTAWSSNSIVVFVVLLPVLVVYSIDHFLNEALLSFVFSTLILVVCFGCAAARACYKAYLSAAFEGDQVSCDIHEQQLRAGRNCEASDDTEGCLSFGQTLMWINYRYYFAIMLFFIVFGAAGAVFYRLLVTVAEKRETEGDSFSDKNVQFANHLLFYIEWLPVRIASLGYMFVGHFGKAMPIWLENLFDVDMKPQQFLAKVSKASEDFMIDDADCTAEPCLLVRLAKRNMLLFLAITALMTLSGTVA